jgi:hypothetical protein
MTQDEFSADLVERCRIAARPPHGIFTTEVIGVLRASKHAELVAALEKARPFVRIAVTRKQADASSRWYDKAFAALATIDAVLAAEPASGEDEMTTIENVHKPYREALKAISPEYIQTSPPIGDRPIDLREENERLREALNLAVSRGCDHCAQTICQARALLAAAWKPQGIWE